MKSHRQSLSENISYKRKFKTQIFQASRVLTKNEQSKKAVFVVPVTKNMREANLLYSRMLLKNTKFTMTELTTLMHMYFELRGPFNLCMTTSTLRSFFIATFDITDDSTLRGLVRGFDRSHSRKISVADFIVGLHTLLRGSLEERARFAFDIFDIDCDGYISRAVELVNSFRDCFVIEVAAQNPILDPTEPERDTIEYLLKTIDVLRRGKFDFDQYLAAVRKNPLLLECCHMLWPEEKYTKLFQDLILSSVSTFSYLPQIEETPDYSECEESTNP